jgi:cytochrome b involved in lipid metabolism
VIVDNLVLDVAEFIPVHPGGKFVIRNLVGTDVSKFFFGGYSLEENTVGRPKGHLHSPYAKMIVNDLAVGIYERDIPVRTEVVQQVQSRCNAVNSETQTVVLMAEQESECFRSYWGDHRMIGKHFRVQYSGKLCLSRHYTICNVMTP